MSAMISASTRCWAEIELDALSHNAGVARNLAGRDSRVLAVVKADARADISCTRAGKMATPVASSHSRNAPIDTSESTAPAKTFGRRLRSSEDKMWRFEY